LKSLPRRSRERIFTGSFALADTDPQGHAAAAAAQQTHIVAIQAPACRLGARSEARHSSNWSINVPAPSMFLLCVLPCNARRHIMLEVAQDSFMAAVYRTALVVALEEFFGHVQIFGDELTLAKYCQKEWPTERMDQIVASMVRNRGLN
jgi:hypothetical protein